MVRRADAPMTAPRGMSPGSAIYIDDMREPEGTLHVAPGGAPVARGRDQALDLDAVRAAPGVVAVLTAATFPASMMCSPVARRRSDARRRQDRVSRPGGVRRRGARRAMRRAAPRGSRKIEIAAGTPLVTVDDALAAETPTSCPTTPSQGRHARRRSRAARSARQRHSCASAGRSISISKARSRSPFPARTATCSSIRSTQHPSEVPAHRSRKC